MYCASPDINETGSTRLHKDATAAVNILAYVCPRSGDTLGRPHGATWLVFSAADTPQVQAFLRRRLDYDDGTDPTQFQRVFIDEAMLVDMKHLGLKPFTIQQHEHDAVFIPAGCPHQVSCCHGIRFF